MEMDKSGKFSIKSVYEHLTKNENGLAYKAIWNAKVPEKVKKNHVACCSKSNSHEG
jgi:hypothetical protein